MTMTISYYITCSMREGYPYICMCLCHIDVWYVDDGTNRGGSLYWGSFKDSRNATAQHLRDVIQVSIGRQTPVFNKLVADGITYIISYHIISDHR